MIKAYKTKPCKGCGGPVRTTLKKPYCSHECRIANRKMKHIEASCAACGKLVKRLVQAFRVNKPVVCDSKCQVQWALIANRGPGAFEVNWESRSVKAKNQWKKQSTNTRKEKSKLASWWRLCGLSENWDSNDGSKWMRRCTSASSMLSQRLNPAIRDEVSINANSWNECSKMAMKALTQKTLRMQQCEWTKKSTMISSALSKRRNLRNAKENTSIDT